MTRVSIGLQEIRFCLLLSMLVYSQFFPEKVKVSFHDYDIKNTSLYLLEHMNAVASSVSRFFPASVHSGCYSRSQISQSCFVLHHMLFLTQIFNFIWV